MIAAKKWLDAPELGRAAHRLDRDDKPDKSIFSTEPVDVWERYERAKRRLQTLNLTPADYDERLRMVAEEIGV